MTKLDQIADLEKRYLLPTYNRYPVAFERGKGVFLFDFERRLTRLRRDLSGRTPIRMPLRIDLRAFLLDIVTDGR